MDKATGLKVYRSTAPVRCYFSLWQLQLRICSESGKGSSQHFNLTTSPIEKVCHELPAAQFSAFNGKVSAWWEQFVGANPVPTETHCWRALNGEKLACAHSQSSSEFCTLNTLVLSIPVCLIIVSGIQVVNGTSVTEDHGEWDFPATLRPGDKSAEGEDGAIYDIVGRAFTSGDHFVARYRDKETSGVFHYDGMRHNGFSQRVAKGKTMTHLVGNKIPLPDGYRTTSVIYHLRGGARAQERFFRDRVNALERIHHIQVESSGLYSPFNISLTMPGTTPVVDRWWTTESSKNFPTKDYNYNPSFKPVVDDDQAVQLDAIFSDDDEVSAVTKTHQNAKHRRVESDDEPEEHASPGEPMDEDDEAADTSQLSSFDFNCRCGTSGDGHDPALTRGEPCVMCDNCSKWSHIACQGERAIYIAFYPRDKFVCESCSNFKLESRRNPHALELRRPLAERLLYVISSCCFTYILSQCQYAYLVRERVCLLAMANFIIPRGSFKDMVILI